MFYALFMGAIVWIDLAAKKIANREIKEGQSIEIVNNKLYFTLIKNRGAAYNILEGKIKTLWIFIATSMTMISIYTAMAFKDSSRSQKVFLFSILSGGLSNCIDRLKNGTVTDFIYIKFKKAPVFNVADLFILFGTIGYLFSLRKK